MEGLNGQEFEDMRPIELKQQVELYLQYIALRPQFERDHAATYFYDICRNRGFEALASVDVRAIKSATRTQDQVVKSIAQHLHGAMFMPPGSNE